MTTDGPEVKATLMRGDSGDFTWEYALEDGVVFAAIEFDHRTHFFVAKVFWSEQNILKSHGRVFHTLPGAQDGLLNLITDQRAGVLDRRVDEVNCIDAFDQASSAVMERVLRKLLHEPLETSTDD